MACLIDNGVVRSCEFQAGGLKSLYIANTTDVTVNLSSTSELSTDDPVVYDQQELRTLVDNLLLGKFVAVAYTKTGQAYVLGKNNSLEASASTFSSGTASDDFAGYIVTLMGEEVEGVPRYSGTAEELTTPGV